LALVVFGFPFTVRKIVSVFEVEVALVRQVDAGDSKKEVAVGGLFAGEVPDFTAGFPGVDEDAVAGVGGLVMDEELHDGPPEFLEWRKGFIGLSNDRR
jgi:hypothetical protein